MKTIGLALIAISATASFAAPAISSVTNAYSYTLPGSPNYGIARGSILVITGAELADTTASAALPLKYELGGVTVRVATPQYEDTVPLYSVSPTRIVCILPSRTPAGPASVTVHGGQVVTAKFEVVESAFGILTRAGSGTGAADAYDGRFNSLRESSSTQPGGIIQIFGTGVGPTTNNELVEQVQTNLTNIPMTAEIGGMPAEILYRGRTIYPGLDQINIRIPDLGSSALTCDVRLVIKSGGISSNAATIPIALNGGDCTPGAAITQSEIDRWSAAGAYTRGTVVLSRYTSYNPSPVTADSTYGDFTLFSGPDLARWLRNDAGVATPAAGHCTVVRGLPNPWPYRIDYTTLEAGPAIQSSGPNGAQLAVRDVDHGVIAYYSSPGPSSHIVPGRYTLSGQGGYHVGSFSGTLDVPTEFVWTNWEEARIVTRANGLTIRWTGGDVTQLVHISGGINQHDPSGIVEKGSFSCYADNAAGQFTVPAAILNQMPATGTGVSSVSVYALSAATRLQASGVDYFIAYTTWGAYLKSEYR